MDVDGEYGELVGLKFMSFLYTRVINNIHQR